MPHVRNALLILLLLLSGCALQPAGDKTVQFCNAALDDLQDTIAGVGVEDAQYTPVSGFPTYRTDRFWSAFSRQSLNAIQEREWRQHLHDLGMQSLGLEWQNLPQEAKQRWQKAHGLNTFDDFHWQCTGPLFNASLQQPVSPDAVKVPDAYNTWQRVLGLYVLTGYLAQDSIADYQREMQALMAQGSTALQQPTQLFAPATEVISSGRFPAPTVSALGIPQYDAATLQALLLWHAPRLQIEQHTAADIPGTARWQNDSRQIDSSAPRLYTYLSYMRYRQQNLLQLNYVAWFSERPPERDGDWYAGKLDGLVWRVTLKADGSVLFYDSIHPCGCYHSIHLPATSTLDIPHNGPEPLMVIHTDLDERSANPVLLVQANTHYLLQVLAQPFDSPATQTYQMENYDQLRSLPNGKTYRNWFDRDGLIAASARKERYYLWPLGVPNAGAMRQRGHHAIAFAGRRHFDAASVEQLLGLTGSD